MSLSSLSASNILDLIMIVIVGLTVIFAIKRGFLSTVFRLCGTAAAVLISWLVSERFSAAVFTRFFRSGIVEKVTSIISEGSSVSVTTIVNRIAVLLPRSLIQKVLAQTGELDTVITSGSPEVAGKIVDTVIQPLFVPIIAVLLFFVTFLITNLLIGFIVSALVKVNNIPVLGKINQLLGAVAGLVLGVIYVMLLFWLLWSLSAITGDGIPFINSSTLGGSWFYNLFSKYNPFVG